MNRIYGFTKNKCEKEVVSREEATETNEKTNKILGKLENLTTEIKDSIVGAINWLKQKLDKVEQELTQTKNKFSDYYPMSGGKVNGVVGAGERIAMWTGSTGGALNLFSTNAQRWQIQAPNDKYIQILTFGSPTNGNAIKGIKIDENGHIFDQDGNSLHRTMELIEDIYGNNLTPVKNKLNRFTDFEEQDASVFGNLLLIDVNNKYGWNNRNIGIYHAKGVAISNSPFSSSVEFHVFREVFYHNPNNIVVKMTETYPQLGRVWMARYDKRSGWVEGWREV